MDELKESPKKLLFKGTMILTLAALFSKVLSAVYRVPFQNIVGDIGFYIYQQIYPFYGIAVAFATYGFPVVISKLYAENIEGKDKSVGNQILLPSFIAVALFNFILFLITYFGSSLLANQMGDEQLKPLIKLVSCTFLVIPFLSVIRGYFQGQGYMVPTALSQVGEQTVRVSLILILSIVLINKGYSLYEIGEGAIVASVLGSLSGAIIIACFFLRHYKKSKRKEKTIRIRVVIKTVLFQGIAVCISSLTLILFQLIDSFQIYPLLKNAGIHMEQAKILKGVYDRGQPLIQLGMVLATSLSLAVVPMIAVMKKRSKEAVAYYIRLAFKISLAVSLAATIGLIMIMNHLNTMLFQNDAGSNVLRIFVIAIILSTVCTTIISVLQGFGIIYYPAITVIIGSMTKLIANGILIRQFNTAGAAISTILSLGIMIFLLVWRLKQVIPMRLITWNFLRGLLKSLLYMASSIVIFHLVCRPLTFQLTSRMFASFYALGATFIGGTVYLITLLRSQCFTNEEIALLPLGNKIKFINKK